MKKLKIAFAALAISMFLFSCTNDSITETDNLYETQSTEGDDGQPDDGRGDDD